MILSLVVAGTDVLSAQTAPATSQKPATRRSQRVTMPALEIVSPDGHVTFKFLPNAERLTFTVTLGNTTVIDPSPIVLNLDGYDLSAGVVMSGVVRDEVKETYPWSGVRSTAVSHSNGAKLSLTNDLTSIPYTLEVRVFNDGIAFRHVIPGDAAVSRVPDEYSTFNLPAGSTVWYAGMEGHYEAPYLKKDVAAVEPGEWAGPPLTFKLPQNGGYASITEANLVNYSGMGLESNGRGGWVIGLGHRQPLNYPFELRYGREEGKRLGKAAAIAGEITTPWRVVMIGGDLNALVTSTILPNLCPPPDPALFPEGIKTSWVKPGRAVWRYVDGGPQGVEGMKEFSRLAGQLGFEYHIIEGVWRKWTMDERRDVVSYSRQQGVGVWFWQHTNQLRTPEARDEFFRLLRDLGVTGAKLDFFDHEAKEIVDLYEALLRKAAEYQNPAGVSRVEQAHRPRAHLAARARARKRARHGVERDAGARTPPDHSSVHAVPRRARRLHDDAVYRAPARLERGAPDCKPRRAREPVADHRRKSREHPGKPGGRRHQEHSVDVG